MKWTRPVTVREPGEVEVAPEAPVEATPGAATEGTPEPTSPTSG